MAEDAATKPVETAAAEGGAPPAVVPAVEEKIDHMEALRRVLKQAIPANGVRRGLRECAQMLTRGVARVCLLAQDCDQGEIVKLIKALAETAEPQVPIFEIESREKLGEWVGLAKMNEEGEVAKVVKCSVAVITDFGQDSHALSVLLDYIAKNKKGNVA